MLAILVLDDPRRYVFGVDLQVEFRKKKILIEGFARPLFFRKGHHCLFRKKTNVQFLSLEDPTHRNRNRNGVDREEKMMRILIRPKQYSSPLWGLSKKRLLSVNTTGTESLSQNYPFLVCTAIVAGLVAAEAGASIIRNFQNIDDIKMKLFGGSVENKTYPRCLFSDYVERQSLEESITREMTKEPDGSYCVVYGNNNVGKSSLMTKCATPKSEEDSKRDYLLIPVGDISSQKTILRSLRKNLQMKDMELTLPRVNDTLKQLYQNKSAPVIVFEVNLDYDVDSSSWGNVLAHVRSLAKSLADSRTCNCFIVLSKPQAIVTFGKDKTREKYIFIDELTIPEATEYIQKSLDQFISEAEMKEKIFDKIGTSPGTLKMLVSDCNSHKLNIEKFVEEWLSDAQKELSQFPFQTILKTIKDLDNPDDGVSPMLFRGLKENNVLLSCPIEVGGAMIESQSKNVIIYRKDTRKYHLKSTAHKTALKRCTTTPPRNWSILFSKMITLSYFS